MRSVVAYMGGKTSSLARLRAALGAERMSVYAEPFVGMGALFLDLVERRAFDSAVVADVNPAVTDFWSSIVDDPEALLRFVDAESSRERTMESYRATMDQDVEPGPARAARFLWLVNYASYNSPPWPRLEGGWDGSKAGRSGVKLSDAERARGRTYPFERVVARTERVAVALRSVRTVVLRSAKEVMNVVPSGTVVYMDPPYHGSDRSYGVDAAHYTRMLPDMRSLTRRTDVRYLVSDVAPPSEDFVEMTWDVKNLPSGRRVERLFLRDVAHPLDAEPPRAGDDPLPPRAGDDPLPPRARRI